MQRTDPSAPCQPFTNVYTLGQFAPLVLSQFFIRKVLQHSKYICFQYTAGQSNNFKLADHVSSHFHWCNLSVIKIRRKCAVLRKPQQIKKELFWNDRRVCGEDSKYGNKMCV